MIDKQVNQKIALNDVNAMITDLINLSKQILTMQNRKLELLESAPVSKVTKGRKAYHKPEILQQRIAYYSERIDMKRNGLELPESEPEPDDEELSDDGPVESNLPLEEEKE